MSESPLLQSLLVCGLRDWKVWNGEEAIDLGLGSVRLGPGFHGVVSWH